MIFIFFSNQYKDGIIETAKCSIKNLKHNFRDRNYPLRLRTDRRK